MPIENLLGSQRSYSLPAKQKENGCVTPRQKEKREYLHEIQEKRKCQR